MKSLAVKYRPASFDDVVEQGSVKIILTQQLKSGEVKNAYLFCGGAGTGKTTCARIYANELNAYKGTPIEIDAASNSSVDDVREIIQQAKTKSLDSEYKVFIIDECHSLSNTAWQALLKLLEEPPAKSIFIFCTTDPQKIPKTILSRVQRYDFQRISHAGVVRRLDWIMSQEYPTYIPPIASLDYIAKLADGGMRDAITLLDKCLAYSTDLTIENIVNALGVADYDTMCSLLDDVLNKDTLSIVSRIETIHRNGIDLKQFMRQFTNFVLDVLKYRITKSFDFISVPSTYKTTLDNFSNHDFTPLLSTLVKLNSDIKWDTTPKPTIEATLILEVIK